MHVFPPDDDCDNNDGQDCQQYGGRYTSSYSHGVSVLFSRVFRSSESWNRWNEVRIIMYTRSTYSVTYSKKRVLTL